MAPMPPSVQQGVAGCASKTGAPVRIDMSAGYELSDCNSGFGKRTPLWRCPLLRAAAGEPHWWLVLEASPRPSVDSNKTAILPRTRRHP